MTPVSYDYKGLQLFGVIDKGVKWFDAKSLFVCMGYSKPKGKSGFGGKQLQLLHAMPEAYKRPGKSPKYVTIDGVLWLKSTLLAKKNLKKRSERVAFFEWFEGLFVNQKQTEQPTIILDAQPVDLGSRVFSGDCAYLIEEIKSLEVQVDKLSGELHAAHERLHDTNVAYEQLQGETDDLREKAELLQDQLDQAHATIYKLIDRL